MVSGVRSAIQPRGEGLAALPHLDPDEDEEPTLAVYCAVCAYVEFGGSRRERTESD